MWTEPGFQAEAEAWIRSQVPVSGPIEQTHVQPWSTVLRVPTDDDRPFWFKACGEEHVFEPSLIELLSRLSPNRVPEMIAIHPERRWMLTRDAGTRLREMIESDGRYEPWLEVLPGYAELQIAAASHVDEILSIGVPHEPLAGLADRVGLLLENPEYLMVGETDGLAGDQIGEVREMLPEIDRLCSDLASLSIPESIQHDDLNDGNVFFDGFGYRVTDWGDACVSHPFHSLTVQLRATAFRLDLEPGGPEILRMRDAYLEPWTSMADRQTLVGAMGIAYRTGTLARSLAWFRYLAERDPAEWGDDVESIPYGLKKFLENGLLGSWRD